MEGKFDHQEYRDNLAKDLKREVDHKDRAHDLDLEKLSFRYDIAREKHLEDVEEKIKHNERINGLKIKIYDNPVNINSLDKIMIRKETDWRLPTEEELQRFDLPENVEGSSHWMDKYWTTETLSEAETNRDIVRDPSSSPMAVGYATGWAFQPRKLCLVKRIEEK